MSFPGTSTPAKPTCKPKYSVNIGKFGSISMDPDVEKEFLRLFPVTMNRKMMELFGISFSTLQRLKRRYGLTKDMPGVRKKLVRQIKKTCEKNGYYESLRGKGPSQACKDAYRAKLASGYHPVKSLKESNPRRYNALMKKRSANRKQIWDREKKLVGWGLSQDTKLHVPQFSYTRSQLGRRCSALKRGYILKSVKDFSGERYCIYYDSETTRSDLFERNCIKNGFSIKKL